jgi:glycosyltransferase involved in cell wall biosynthesis
MKKRYSVIIPHYKDTERLVRLLESIPIEREDVEVLVIDDRSPNQDALDILRSNWLQVNWLATTENAGAGVARNVGLDFATGQWLLFADSDDEFLPSAFDIFDEVLRDNDELVYFLAEGMQEFDGRPSSSVEPLNVLVSTCSAELTDENLQQLRLHHVVPWAKVYSRFFIRSTGLRFDPTRFGNDVAFNVLAAVQAKKIRVMALQVYRY